MSLLPILTNPPEGDEEFRRWAFEALSQFQMYLKHLEAKQLGVQVGRDIFDSSGNLIASQGLLQGDVGMQSPLIANPEMLDPRVNSDGSLRPKGWYIFQTVDSVLSNVGYFTANDPTSGMQAAKTSSINIAYVSNAFRVDPNKTLEFLVELDADSSSPDGLYIRVCEYDSELDPSLGQRAIGRTTVSNTEASDPEIVERDREVLFTGLENVGVNSTNPSRYTATYTPSSTAKWASLVIFIWNNLKGKNVRVRRAYVSDAATKGATWGTDIANEPSQLADINSTEGSKLGGIEDGATKGAKSGVNLYRADGATVIAEEEILDIYASSSNLIPDASFANAVSDGVTKVWTTDDGGQITVGASFGQNSAGLRFNAVANDTVETFSKRYWPIRNGSRVRVVAVVNGDALTGEASNSEFRISIRSVDNNKQNPVDHDPSDYSQGPLALSGWIVWRYDITISDTDAAFFQVHPRLVAGASTSGYVALSFLAVVSDELTQLSDLNPTEGTKLAGIEDGATVGADWNTNLVNKPAALQQIFYQSAAPTSGMVTNDLWIDSDDKKIYRYSGTSWDLSQDSDIAKALNDAATAQATADGKIKVFRQTTQPTAEGTGDIWIDTDDDEKPYVWDGSAWVAVNWDGAVWSKVAGSGKPADNATVGATWGTDINNQPSQLSDINSTEGSKLGGIEDNATKGATVGTDLKDSSSNVLGDTQVLNVYDDEDYFDNGATVPAGSRRFSAFINNITSSNPLWYKLLEVEFDAPYGAVSLVGTFMYGYSDRRFYEAAEVSINLSVAANGATKQQDSYIIKGSDISARLHAYSEPDATSGNWVLYVYVKLPSYRSAGFRGTINSRLSHSISYLDSLQTDADAVAAPSGITEISPTFAHEFGATVGATWGSNITNEPTALSDINSTEGTKLTGIEDGATVGADWNTNLTNKPAALQQIFYQSTAPTSGMVTNDLWIDSDDKKIYRYSGTAWDLSQDSDIAKALNDAATAQATADGKIKVFRQTTQPTAEGTGDIWIDTDDDEKPYVWDGSSWVAVNWDGAVWSKVGGSGKPADNATVGATWGTDINNQPSQLADINSTEGSKLGGIEDNATKGATIGTDLKDSGSNILSDTQVLNIHDDEAAFDGGVSLSAGTYRFAAYINNNTSSTNWFKLMEVEVDSGYDAVALTGFFMKGESDRRYTNACRINISLSTGATADALSVWDYQMSGTDLSAYLKVYHEQKAGTGNWTLHVYIYLAAHDSAAIRGNITATKNFPSSSVDSVQGVANAVSAPSGLIERTPTKTYEIGATVGATWGSNITNEPTQLADINSTEGSKLGGIEDGATVGADWNTNLTNKPAALQQIFYQSAAPTSGMVTNDIWIDSDDKKIYRYSGSAWELSQDSDIAKALNDAATAQATADGKIKVFRQTTQPTAEGTGDIWIDTDDDEKPYVWDGSAWVAVNWDGGVWSKISGTGKPADNATVGATWGTDINNQPTQLADINSVEGSKLGGIEDGATANVWRGAWSSSSVAYALNDMVSYSGRVYICIQANTSSGSNAPSGDTTSNTWWEMFADKGEQGPQGPQGPSGVLLFNQQSATSSASSGASVTLTGVVANKPIQVTFDAFTSYSSGSNQAGTYPVKVRKDGADWKEINIQVSGTDLGGGLGFSGGGRGGGVFTYTPTTNADVTFNVIPAVVSGANSWDSSIDVTQQTAS